MADWASAVVGGTVATVVGGVILYFLLPQPSTQSPTVTPKQQVEGQAVKPKVPPCVRIEKPCPDLRCERIEKQLALNQIAVSSCNDPQECVQVGNKLYFNGAPSTNCPNPQLIDVERRMYGGSGNKHINCAMRPDGYSFLELQAGRLTLVQCYPG